MSFELRNVRVSTLNGADREAAVSRIDRHNARLSESDSPLPSATPEEIKSSYETILEGQVVANHQVHLSQTEEKASRAERLGEKFLTRTKEQRQRIRAILNE